MSDSSLGLTEGISIALGGMIGGGIFAVLGVVVQITRGAAWAAFVLAGAVALCAAYSFNALNELADGQGGAVTFVQCFLGNATVAGMAGWTLLFGYVGSMAMYAFAFGSFTVGLAVVPDAVAAGTIPGLQTSLATRPVVSVAAVAGFVGLNILGARATGTVENVLVGAKVAVLLLVGVGGIAYGVDRGALVLGLDRLATVGPVVAAGVSFVAFQGWQLLFYDQESFDDPVPTIRRAVYVSIVAAVALYVLVAITTVSLAPLSVIQSHPERALAVAADPFLPAGFVIVSLAALFSTGSAINATLFSSGHFTKNLLSNDLVPDHLGDATESGVPSRTIVVLGVLVAAFSAYGSLGAITSFASLTFILVFGATNALALRERGRDRVAASIPAVGLAGSVGFFALMLWHLWTAERGTFVAVALLAVAVLAVETLYFERDAIEREVVAVEEVLKREVDRGER